MHMKPSSFQGFTPILSTAQLCKYARKVLTDIANSNVSPLCTELARRGRQNLKRIATPWSNGKWREHVSLPVEVGTCLYSPVFPAPWLRNQRPLFLSNGLKDLSSLQTWYLAACQYCRRVEEKKQKSRRWLFEEFALKIHLISVCNITWSWFISLFELIDYFDFAIANLLDLNWVSVLHVCPMGHQLTWFNLFLSKI